MAWPFWEVPLHPPAALSAALLLERGAGAGIGVKTGDCTPWQWA